MYRRMQIFILLIIIPFVLCGCWDQVLVEKTGFMTIVGIEPAPQGNLKLTYSMPIVDPDTTIRSEVLDTQSNPNEDR